MKEFMQEKMDRLEIDLDIRPLLSQMWERGYETVHSCSGKFREGEGYLTFFRNTGDGWFESVAEKLGWRTTERKEKKLCCYKELVSDILNYKNGNFEGWPRYCTKCGNGLGDIIAYRNLSCEC